MAELGERMSALEFAHWQAFWEEEPIGPHAGLHQIAALLAAHANGPLKAPAGRKAWAPSDFTPRLWEPPQPKLSAPSAAQIKAQLRAMSGLLH